MSKPHLITFFLGGIACSLVLASIFGQIMTYLLPHNRVQYILSTLFFVDREKNIPTAFSALLLLFAACLLFRITFLIWKKEEAVSKWLVLACGFILMSIDEYFSFHERLIRPVRGLIQNLFNVEKVGIFKFAWVIPGIILVGFLLIYFWDFVHALPQRTKRLFILSASIYLSGAIGTELIGGAFFESYGPQNLVYSMIVTVEESLEMAGIILFIWTLLKYMKEPLLKQSAQEI
ncbi:MAG: hypothetical protein WBB82_03390 [Limnothrix sp.]